MTASKRESPQQVRVQISVAMVKTVGLPREEIENVKWGKANIIRTLGYSNSFK